MNDDRTERMKKNIMHEQANQTKSTETVTVTATTAKRKMKREE